MSNNIVFMGSPEYSVTILEELSRFYPMVGVITQPDKPAGRGKQLTPPPVKLLAEKLNLEVIQPPIMKATEVFEKLQQWAPDVIVVAAYGKILRQNVLDLPRWGCINVHASYLPRWRGAAPIQAAILSGDAWTGVSIMRMDNGIDTGPILSRTKVPIMSDDNALTLERKLAQTGASLLIETLHDYLAGRIKPFAQDEEGATYAPMIKKEQGLLDFKLTAVELERRVRAFYPWPGAQMVWQGQMLKIIKSELATSGAAIPGIRFVSKGYPAVGTGEGSLALIEVQPAGKKRMDGRDFLRGTRNWETNQDQ